MQVTEITDSGLKREFKVLVPAAEIEARVHGRLSELTHSVRLPGFRPGKVPIALMKKRFGPSVMGEVLERTVNESSMKTLADRGLRPALQPKIEITAFADGKDLEYTMAVEVLPEIKPVDFTSLKLERLVVGIDEGNVDKALDRMAEAHRATETVADKRPAAKGDVLVIGFAGTIDGEDFPGGRAEGYELELGSASFIPGFEDQLVGVRAGDHRQVKVQFPAEYAAANLAGKEAVFAVDVKELKATRPAAVDDELAKRMGMSDLAALRKAVREEHEREFKALSRMRLKRSLLDSLASAHDFELPAGLVEAEFESIWKAVQEEEKRSPDAVDPADKEKSEDERKAELRAIAVRRLRLGLLLSEVGRANNLQVTQDDLNRAAMAEARRHPGQEQAVLDFYRKTPEAMEQLSGPVYEDKVIDFILEMAPVTERAVTLEELLKDPDAEGKVKPAAASG